MKQWIGLFLASISLNAASESIMQMKHAAWESRVVYDKQQVRFRSIAEQEGGDIYAILTADRLPDQCGLQYLTLTLASKTQNDADFELPSGFGMIRIDDKPVHNMTYVLSGKAKEKFFFATINNFDGESTIIPELTSGQYVRFKLHTDKQDYFFRFALNGYDAAQKRTLSLCSSMNPSKKDGDFFKPKASPGTTPDSAYF